MSLQISGKQMNVGDALTARIEDRIEDAVTKYFQGGYQGKVTLEKQGSRFSCDCVIHLDSNINLQGTGFRDERYKAFQLKLQRPFANGFNFLVGYNYSVGQNQQFYDDVDHFDRRLTFQDDAQNGQKLNIASMTFQNGNNNESTVALSGRYTVWAKSAAFTYDQTFPGFGERLMWKIQTAGTPNWKSSAPSGDMEEELKASLEVYPNPANDQISLSISDAADGYQYEVSNQLGQVIRLAHTSSVETRLSVADFPAGMYMVKFVNDKTQATSYAKFIKQ